jgi:4,5-dihydroxyphthalate decarboxylase
VKFQYIDAARSIGSMMMNDELDATLLYIGQPSLVDRSTVRFDEANTKVRPLFVDAAAEAQRFYGSTGIFPINHGVVMRRSLYERHPWLALNIFNAFRLAKEHVMAEASRRASTHLELGLLGPSAAAALSRDVYPYGVRSNRKTLETMTAYSAEQGLTPHQVAIEDIFAPSTLDL